MAALSPKLPWELANPKWAAALNPLLASPLAGGQVLTGIVLTTGDNVINHGLGEKLQGWMVTRLSAAVTIYDKQTANQTPQTTLVLTASGAATISLYVF